MTREDKSKAIDDWCVDTNCDKCPLDAIVDGFTECCSMALESENLPCDIDRNYKILVDAGLIESENNEVKSRDEEEFKVINTRDKLVEILDNFYYKNGDTDEESSYSLYFTNDECELLADYLIENNVYVAKWHRERPTKDGKYLVRKRFMFDNTEYITILNWANNLYDVDNWNFCDKKNVCGWYDYDSEYGYYDVEERYIIEWMELPK